MDLEEQASTPFAGGIMIYGYQCGIIWGAPLAAGAQAYRLYGAGPQAEAQAIIAAQRLVESFRALNNHIDCVEITGLDKSSSVMQMVTYFLIKAGAIHCIRRTAKYAPVAFSEINTAFSETHVQAPASPVSCAAVLAQKMDLSDMHTVMVAGFAGGIGLSGSACGALGTAIWIFSMNILKEGSGPIDFNDSRVLDVIDRFTKCTDHKFKCSEIVGRKFESIDDHAEYLRNGGCSEIIGVLATV